MTTNDNAAYRPTHQNLSKIKPTVLAAGIVLATSRNDIHCSDFWADRSNVCSLQWKSVVVETCNKRWKVKPIV